MTNLLTGICGDNIVSAGAGEGERGGVDVFRLVPCTPTLPLPCTPTLPLRPHPSWK